MAKFALTERIKQVFAECEFLRARFMGHGQHRDAYRLEAPPRCELSQGPGLGWVVKVERPRWIDGVYQHPDNEKEAKFCLNVSRRVSETNF